MPNVYFSVTCIFCTDVYVHSLICTLYHCVIKIWKSLSLSLSLLHPGTTTTVYHYLPTATGLLPVLRIIPLELLFFHQLDEFDFVWEEHGEVGGEDAVLDVAQHLLVFC